MALRGNPGRRLVVSQLLDGKAVIEMTVNAPALTSVGHHLKGAQVYRLLPRQLGTAGQ